MATEISPLAYVHPEARLGENVKVYPFAYIERDVVIGDNCVIMSHASVLEGSVMGADNYIYQNAVIGAQVAGECQLEHHVILSSGVILQHLARVGRYSLIQSGCVVQKDVPPYIILGGNPVSYHGVSAVILEKEGLSERTLRHIANAYRIVYTGNESLEDAVQKIVNQIPGSAEIDNIVSFIRDSKRGIVRRTQ
ncbi:MAG: acyl-ACP--UDP-N-acetylglucosamine O-acyltransferase [Alloprevotella sp.]|nr:acyl-ACP--UDP-N-acetylglucosamine O-acyltransferase [Alloprevotella sp.]